MCKKPFTWLLPGMMLAISACSADSPPGLRDTTAATIIQKRWNEASSVPIKPGIVPFHGDRSSSAMHASFSEYPKYQAAAHMKLIKLENDRPLSQRVATISLTPAGQKIATTYQVKKGDLRFATFPCGEYRVEKIIRNKPLEISGNKYLEYRVVTGTHVFELRTEFRELCLAHGEAETRGRHFRALLKHDPVANNWSLEASDAGLGEFDFESTNVLTALAALRAR
jgi:hypothetical protein